MDGTLRHIGTTWEDYFRWCTESGGGPVPLPIKVAQSTRYYSGLAAGSIVTGLHDGLPVGFTMIAADYGELAPGVFTLVLSDGYTTTGTLTNGTIEPL